MVDVGWHVEALPTGFVVLAAVGVLLIGLHLLSETILDHLKRKYGIERWEVEGKLAIVATLAVVSYCIGRAILEVY